MWTDEEIKGKILHKLVRGGKFEHSHTSIDNLSKGIPRHLRGRAKSLINELKKEGILLIKPTFSGKHVSINLERREKVKYYVDKFLDKE